MRGCSLPGGAARGGPLVMNGAGQRPTTARGEPLPAAGVGPEGRPPPAPPPPVSPLPLGAGATMPAGAPRVPVGPGLGLLLGSLLGSGPGWRCDAMRAAPLRCQRGRRWSRRCRHVFFFVNRSHLHTTISIHKKKNNNNGIKKKKKRRHRRPAAKGSPRGVRGQARLAEEQRAAGQAGGGGRGLAGPRGAAARRPLTRCCGKAQLGEVPRARDPLHS